MAVRFKRDRFAGSAIKNAGIQLRIPADKTEWVGFEPTCPRGTTAFRVRLIATTLIPLQVLVQALFYYTVLMAASQQTVVTAAFFLYNVTVTICRAETDGCIHKDGFGLHIIKETFL